MFDLALVADQELLTRTVSLAHQERLLTAELIAHLVELDRRGAVLRAGYSCLFVYCRDALGMSEGEAYNRSVVTEAARRFPAILEALQRGDVTLTGVRLVAPHLTQENCHPVLQSIRGRKKAEIEQIVAALAPRADVPTVVRKLPAPRQAALVAPAPRPVVVAPTAPDRYRLQVALDGEAVETLKRLRELTGQAEPELVERALTVLLQQIERQKHAATPAPRLARPSHGRHVPAEVRRAVWARDRGQCAFVGERQRCTERNRLEYHHRHPYAMGGPATVENISLRCRAHNGYESDVDYGRRSGTTDRSGVARRPRLAEHQYLRSLTAERPPALVLNKGI